MEKNTKKSAKPISNDELISHENDPFIIKKKQQAKERLEKYGFPKELPEIRYKMGMNQG